jgi:hypothetical protein
MSQGFEEQAQVRRMAKASQVEHSKGKEQE